jgi:hypothetical protein
MARARSTEAICIAKQTYRALSLRRVVANRVTIFAECHELAGFHAHTVVSHFFAGAISASSARHWSSGFWVRGLARAPE